MKVRNNSAGFIGYRLNILGIRVWENACQLVAKTPQGWTTLGGKRSLPIQIPRTADELQAASNDPLLLQAYQYESAFPASDLRDVLAKKKAFQSACEDGIPLDQSELV
jgi:hypothetical protein